MKKIYLLLILLPLSLFSNDFQQGNIAFTDKNYDKAIEHYKNDIERFGYSVETLYNLSNIYQQLEQPGYALYYLYKARILNPMEKYIQTDINVIEKGLELEDNYKHLLPIPYYIIDLILPISLLLITITITIYLFIKEVKIKRIIRYLSYVTLFFVLMSSLIHIYTITKNNDAIILKDSNVQLSPYDSSEVTFNISEASIITISDNFEEYLYITDNSDRYGWIKKDLVGEIWK